MQRALERRSQLDLTPNGSASLSTQEQRLLQVREEGDGTVQRRHGVQPWKSQQLQRLVKGLRRQWEEAPNQEVRDLERLYLAHLLGVGGGLAKDNEPASMEPVQRAAGRQQRAKEKHRAAPREERSPKQEPARQQTCLTKSRKKAVGAEKPAATRASALAPSPPSPPDKGKGKRASSMQTTGGGRRHPDPWGSRGIDVERLNPFLAAAQDTKHLEERAKKTAREGKQQPGKGVARFMQGPKSNALDLGLEGKLKDPGELQPVGSTRRREAVSLGPLSRRGDLNAWQRELEHTFEELFASNRELKRHLSLHLDPRSRMEQQHSKAEQGFSEVQGQKSETQREEESAGAAAGPLWESWSPEEVEAPQTPSRVNLKQLPGKMERPACRVAKPTPKATHRASGGVVESGGQAASPQAGVLANRENPLLGSTEAEGEPPQLAPLLEGSLELCPQERTDRHEHVVASWQRHKAKTEPPGLLEHRASPKPSLDLPRAQLEEERALRRERVDTLRSPSPRGQEEEGGYKLSTTSASGTSFVDDDGHCQVIRDLQQQISEQNKLHKQFLEEARKRLQEFQKIS